VCRASAGVCDVVETCSGLDAQCPADRFASNAAVCRAATDVCDAAEHCTGSSGQCPADATLPVGATCDDGDDCTLAESCNAGTCGGGTVDPVCLGCPVSPLAGCGAAEKGELTLREGRGVHRNSRLSWSWEIGSIDISELGDPTLDTRYHICLYADDELIQEATVEPGTGWDVLKNGFVFVSGKGNEAGITRLRVEASDRKATILVRGEGDNLVVPDLPLDYDTSVLIQLGNDAEGSSDCWETELLAPADTNRDTQFIDDLR